MYFDELPIDIQNQIYNLHFRDIFTDQVLKELLDIEYSIRSRNYSSRRMNGGSTQYCYLYEMMGGSLRREGVKYGEVNHLSVSSPYVTSAYSVKDILCYNSGE